MVEKIVTYVLEEHGPGSAQDWRASSDLWSPANDIFWGTLPPFFVFLWPTKGVGLCHPKVFSLPPFQISICSFCNKVVQRHMSRSFSTIRLFRRSLSCNFPFQQFGIGTNVNVSNMPPWILLHVNEKNCFLNSRKDFISVFANAQLVLLSVYPTYPLTFYVNPTKRHVTWSICLSTKEWHFVFSGTQYSRDSSSSWSRSLSSPSSTWGFSCSSR